MSHKGPPDPRKLAGTAVLRLLSFSAILGLMLFLAAGTIQYWEAWIYLGILVTPATCVMIYLLKNEPELLERRMRLKEREPEQRAIMKVGYLLFAVAFLIPGFDKRYHWSFVPPAVVLASDAIVLIGYLLFVLVIKENRYASRVIEVEQEQKVITTGPYEIVRHPMYVAVSLIYGFSPMALGSYWALTASAMFIALLVVRILNEEKVLLRDLKGYEEYARRTKYRLIPGIW